MGVGARDGYASKKNNISVSLCLHSLAWTLDSQRNTFKTFQNLFFFKFWCLLLDQCAELEPRWPPYITRALLHHQCVAPILALTFTPPGLCTFSHKKSTNLFSATERIWPTGTFWPQNYLQKATTFQMQYQALKYYWKGRHQLKKLLLSGIFVIRAKRCF